MGEGGDNVEFVQVEEFDYESTEWVSGPTFPAEMHEYHNDNVYLGATIAFDIPDGTYSDGTQRIRRWTMESATPSWRLVNARRFVGFVHVEVFEDEQEADFAGYHKQRWTLLSVPASGRRPSDGE